MSDPVFGNIRFGLGAWDGVVPFEFPVARTTKFAVHIWSSASGPTADQRATFEQLQARYAALWPDIARSLVACHPEITTTEQVEQNLRETVACYIEAAATAGHNDFELVYEFDLPRESGRGYFVRICGWKIVEAVMAV